MRLGISSFAFAWAIGVPGNPPVNPMTVFQLVDQAICLGVSCVQFADNLPLHKLTQNEQKELLDYTNQLNIAIEVGTRGFIAENVERYILLAEKFNSPILRMVIDTDRIQPNIDTIIGIGKDFVAELKKRNIVLAIENHDRFKAKEFVQIIEGIQSKQVGICLDSVNSIGAGESTEFITDLLAPYTVNLHIKEFMVERIWHMMGFAIEGRPLGEGMLPLEWMLERMNDRCQSAILEQWPPPEKQLEQTILKEREWAIQSIEYLKQKIF